MPINLQQISTNGVDGNDIQIRAESGLTLYATNTNPTGNYLYVGVGYESYSAADWANYVIQLAESAPGSGIYIGKVPGGQPGGVSPSLSFLAIWVQAGASPASTDCQYRGHVLDPLILAVNWDDGVESIIPLGRHKDRQVSLPSENVGSNLSRAARILDGLFTARERLSTGRVSAVTVDGTSTTFYSPGEVDTAILFWQRQVALLSGQRRRIMHLNF